jgi:hypothetical protein
MAIFILLKERMKTDTTSYSFHSDCLVLGFTLVNKALLGRGAGARFFSWVASFSAV